MKKLLLLSVFLSLGIVYCFGQTTKRLYPKSSFVGITKHTETYKVQAINSTTKSFYLGHNTKETAYTYGRGYLEFDLKDIPKDAIINSVSLQLTSEIAFDSNYNGKITLRQTSMKIFAEEFEWISLGNGPEIATFDIGKEGDGKEISNEYLKRLVSEYKGKQIYLSLNHTDQTKIIRLLGSQQDLFLDVTYSNSNEETPSLPSVEKELSGPQSIYVGDFVMYKYSELVDPSIGYYLNWSYDFQYMEPTYINKLGIRSFQAKYFTEKDLDKDFIETEITAVRYDNWKSDNPRGVAIDYGNIKIKIFAKPNLYITHNHNVTCNGDNTTYTITGFPNSSSKAEVIWEAISNSSLISGQGTKNGTFKVSGNGSVKIKATVKYNGLTYNLENSSVWVGVPIIKNVEKSRTPQLSQTTELYAKEAGFNTVSYYKWSKVSGSFSLNSASNHYATLTPFDYGYIVYKVEAYNRCGMGNYMEQFYISGGNSGGGGGSVCPYPDPNDPRCNLTEFDGNDLRKRSMSTVIYEDIRIFSFSTGQIVYQEKKTVDFKIENTTLKQGIYIVESTDENGNITRTKVMKK